MMIADFSDFELLGTTGKHWDMGPLLIAQFQHLCIRDTNKGLTGKEHGHTMLQTFRKWQFCASKKTEDVRGSYVLVGGQSADVWQLAVGMMSQD
jgi:hypothetical protein